MYVTDAKQNHQNGIYALHGKIQHHHYSTLVHHAMLTFSMVKFVFCTTGVVQNSNLTRKVCALAARVVCALLACKLDMLI